MFLYFSFIFYQLIKQRLNVYGYYTFGYCFQNCYNKKNIKINISIKGEQLFFIWYLEWLSLWPVDAIIKRH